MIFQTFTFSFYYFEFNIFLCCYFICLQFLLFPSRWKCEMEFLWRWNEKQKRYANFFFISFSGNNSQLSYIIFWKILKVFKHPRWCFLPFYERSIRMLREYTLNEHLTLKNIKKNISCRFWANKANIRHYTLWKCWMPLKFFPFDMSVGVELWKLKILV